MADISTFVVPAWLDEQDAETIHRRMMANLPDDIDDTEGGFPWDFTKPTALEKAELLQFDLMEALKLMHYMFAYGIYLDYHAHAYNITRRAAVAATGTLLIAGEPGTIIESGFQFAVPGNGNSAAVIFETTAESEIGTDGTAEIAVQAQEAGVASNVPAQTVSIMVQPIGGIESITNPAAITGGTEEEDDDTLRERIKEYLETADVSFVGCDADYRRWAKEVDGVGEVVVMPEWNGPGTVKVIVLNLNGEPASATIVDNVYQYIVSPDDRYKRLAPIGATVTVAAPTERKINVSCHLSFVSESDTAAIIEQITVKLNTYFRNVPTVKRSYVGSLILSVDGVSDYSNLLLDGGTDNITINQDEYPELGVFITDAEGA